MYDESSTSRVHFGGHGWDGVMLFAEAVKKADRPSPRPSGQLEKIKDFVGVAGIFSFSPTDHNGLDACLRDERGGRRRLEVLTK
jgi:ABC-type branched-subunit amino acid transport system substrate-binding protein